MLFIILYYIISIHSVCTCLPFANRSWTCPALRSECRVEVAAMLSMLKDTATAIAAIGFCAFENSFTMFHHMPGQGTALSTRSSGQICVAVIPKTCLWMASCSRCYLLLKRRKQLKRRHHKE